MKRNIMAAISGFYIGASFFPFMYLMISFIIIRFETTTFVNAKMLLEVIKPGYILTKDVISSLGELYALTIELMSLSISLGLVLSFVFLYISTQSKP